MGLSSVALIFISVCIVMFRLGKFPTYSSVLKKNPDLYFPLSNSVADLIKKLQFQIPVLHSWCFFFCIIRISVIAEVCKYSSQQMPWLFIALNTEFHEPNHDKQICIINANFPVLCFIFIFFFLCHFTASCSQLCGFRHEPADAIRCEGETGVTCGSRLLTARQP